MPPHASGVKTLGDFMKIERIIAREIYDSRGYPTIECDMELEDGIFVTASVPSGRSRGVHEAIELRDGGDRLMGQGVLKAIDNIEQIIAPALINKEPDLITMDIMMLEMDGTDNKSVLGANAMLAVSTVLLKAQAAVEALEPFELLAHLCGLDSIALPLPMFNMINGGAHAHNNLRIQEFLVVPVDVPSFRVAMESAATLYHELGSLLLRDKKFLAVGDEGGFSTMFKNDIEALDYLVEAIEQCKGKTKGSFVLALDVAASQFYNKDTQKYDWFGKHMSSEQMISFYEKLIKKYPIYSIEDGLSEHDVDAWKMMTQTLINKVQLVGDDIFVTNAERIWKGIEQGIGTAVIIKPNQVGTITETLQAIKLCKENGMNVIVSHRSGETNDTFIADLAAGTSAGHIKAGGLSRGERMAKYNHLLRIEDELVLNLLGA